MKKQFFLITLLIVLHSLSENAFAYDFSKAEKNAIGKISEKLMQGCGKDTTYFFTANKELQKAIYSKDEAGVNRISRDNYDLLVKAGFILKSNLNYSLLAEIMFNACKDKKKLETEHESYSDCYVHFKKLSVMENLNNLSPILEFSWVADIKPSDVHKSLYTFYTHLIRVLVFQRAATELSNEIPSNTLKEEIAVFPPEKKDSLKKEEQVYDVVEIAPSYPLSKEELKARLTVKDAAIKGKVYIQFIVNKDGTVYDFKVLRGLSEQQDKKAIELIKSLGNWIPGTQNGVKVNCRYTQPVYFE
ncbi:MAG: energy transducer TonB [Flavobacteriales bacterium]|nr:energy transducer TonB [Flavobacteriales bacterium]